MNNNKGWEKELDERFIGFHFVRDNWKEDDKSTAELRDWCKSFINKLLQKEREKNSKEMADAILVSKEGWIEEGAQKERQHICEELEERFIDIWRNSGAKSKTEYYPTLKMLLDELEAIQKINEPHI